MIENVKVEHNKFLTELKAKHEAKVCCARLKGNRQIERKALELIESLLPENEEFKPVSIKEASETLSAIYVYAHAANRFNTCYDVHNKWREHINDEFKKLVEEEGERL